MLKLAHFTAFISAIFTALMLKGLHFFRFIDWRPTGFLHVIEQPFLRYVVLAAIIYIVALLIFIAGAFMRITAVAAIFLALLTVFIVEFVLLEQKLVWQSFSFSFFALTVIMYRFIIETASFHQKTVQK